MGRSPVPESESPTMTRSGSGPASSRSSSQVLSPPVSARQRGTRRTRPDRGEGGGPKTPDHTPHDTCGEGWNATDKASDPSRQEGARSQRHELVMRFRASKRSSEKGAKKNIDQKKIKKIKSLMCESAPIARCCSRPPQRGRSGSPRLHGRRHPARACASSRTHAPLHAAGLNGSRRTDAAPHATRGLIHVSSCPMCSDRVSEPG